MYVCQRDGVKTESRHGTLTQILTPLLRGEDVHQHRVVDYLHRLEDEA
jgi:hypothetical protein